MDVCEKDGFTFELIEAQQHLNPGYGVWKNAETSQAIIQTAANNSKHLSFIPCLITGENTMQGINGYNSVKTWKLAMAEFLKSSLSENKTCYNCGCDFGYGMALSGSLGLLCADCYDDVEGGL